MNSSTDAIACTTGSMLTQWLPKDFKPTKNEIMIGRGRRIQQHAGNLKLQSLVQLKAKAYSQNSDKTHKSFIISEIGMAIKQGSQYGGFVKKDTKSGLWYVVSESCIRSTIAQTFRDTLSPNYRSSKFSKQRRRWSERTTDEDRQSVVDVVKMTSTDAKSTAAAKPLVGAFSSFRPITMISLQQAMRPPVQVGSPSQLPPLVVSSTSPVSETETTSDILKNCLDIISSEDEAWISYSDNPFEPNPIVEQTLVLEEASNPDWWI